MMKNGVFFAALGGAFSRLPPFVRAGLLLFILAGGGALAVEFSYRAAQKPIAAAQAARFARQLQEALAGANYDNAPMAERFSIAGLNTANARGIAAYPAKKNGATVAVVARIIALRGYGGEMELLIGVSPRLQLRGVFVLRHRETPGLGDFIVRPDNAWMASLRGRGSSELENNADGATGATITAAAVMRAARDVLQYAAAHREGWFDGRSD